MHRKLIEEFSLEGRVAVVTGAASGIGAECARVLAEAGASVIAADIDEAGLAATCSSIAAAGGMTEARRCDVASREEVEALAGHALARRGRIDVWVNAAGALIRRRVEEASEADIDRLFSINLKGTYWGTVAARNAMADGSGGAIVNISSCGAEGNNPGLSIYAMTKASVNALSRTAAKEFGPLGIRVNVVSPGWVETPLALSGYGDLPDGSVSEGRRAELIAQRAGASPLGLTGTPRDIALAALYFASPAARFVTGQIFRPNGGISML